MDEASRLRRSGHGEAAHLLAWATVEALVRQVLGSNHVTLGSESAVEAIKALFAYGLIARGDYEVLHAALRHRNQLAHPSGLSRTGPNTAALLRVAERLLPARVVLANGRS